ASLEIGGELPFHNWIVLEGNFLGVFFQKEVKGIDDRHVRDEIDFDGKFRSFVREHESCEMVAVRILLPVNKMAGRRNFKRIARDWGSAVRRWTQADDVRRKPYRSGIAIESLVI